MLWSYLHVHVACPIHGCTHGYDYLLHGVHTQICSLGGCNTISDSGATHLAEGLAHCPHLKELK